MPRIQRVSQLVLHTEDEHGGSVTVEYDNMGEPYREGITITLRSLYGTDWLRAFLETHEVIKLRDKLNELLPPE